MLPCRRGCASGRKVAEAPDAESTVDPFAAPVGDGDSVPIGSDDVLGIGEVLS